MTLPLIALIKQKKRLRQVMIQVNMIRVIQVNMTWVQMSDDESLAGIDYFKKKADLSSAADFKKYILEMLNYVKTQMDDKDDPLYEISGSIKGNLHLIYPQLSTLIIFLLQL